MANRFWVGGSGTWTTAATTNWSTTSGGAGGASAPTAADDVIVDGSSGSPTITIDTATTPVCRSLTTTGATVAFSYQNSTSAHIKIGNSTGGAMVLSTTTSFTNTSANADGLQFVSTSNNGGAGWTIDTANRTIPTVTFNGTGGGWVLANNLNVTTNGTGQINLVAGSLDTSTSNYSVSGWTFLSTGTGVRSLIGNSSTFTFSSNTSTAWNCPTATNMTLSMSSATVNLTGAGPGFSQGTPLSGTNFGTLSITGPGTPLINVSSTISYANFTRIGSGLTTDGVQFNSNPTITGTLTLGGNTTQGPNRLFVSSNVTATQHTLTCNGTIAITGDVDFQDINIAGTGTWTNTGSAFIGDALGNGGLITTNATPSTTCYLVMSGSGNWSGSFWATSSGGTAGGQRAPLPQDNVIMDANSNNHTLVTDMPRLGTDIDFSAFPGTITNTGGAPTVTIFGNWKQYAKSYGTGNTLALGGRGNQTYTSNGGSLTQQIRIRAFGGSYTFVDDFTSGRGDIAIVTDGGDITFQGNVTIPGFQGSAVRECTINMGNGTWTLTSTAAETLWTTNNANVTLNAQGSNIVIATASSNNRFISGGAFGALPPITYSNASTGSLIFTGTTPSFLGLTVGAGETITFTSGITYNIAAFNVSGASGNLTTINSTTPGTAGTLNYTGTGVVSCNYLTIQDSLPVQTNTWYAGSNSTLVSNTGNWIPATLLFATISVIDSLTVSSIVQAIMPNSTLANIVTLLINPIVQAVLGLTSFAALVTLTILDKILDPYNLESTTITLESTNVNVPMQEKNVSVSMQNKNVSVKL